MSDIKFYELENIDGYFSGYLYLYDENKRYILQFGFDIELESLYLLNCKDIMYNTEMVEYDADELSQIREKYEWMILDEIRYCLNKY